MKTLNCQSIQLLADLEQKFILKAYSPSTVKYYTSSLTQFLAFFEIRNEEIEAFVNHQITKYRISESAQITLINEIKAYYEHVLGKERTVYEIQRPKNSLTLPNILIQEEVKGILHSVDNLKHRAVLMLIYSAGLSISEAMKLRNRYIHLDEGYNQYSGRPFRKVIRIPGRQCIPYDIYAIRFRTVNMTKLLVHI